MMLKPCMVCNSSVTIDARTGVITCPKCGGTSECRDIYLAGYLWNHGVVHWDRREKTDQEGVA